LARAILSILLQDKLKHNVEAALVLNIAFLRATVAVTVAVGILHIKGIRKSGGEAIDNTAKLF
jgi:hypothetical protein